MGMYSLYNSVFPKIDGNVSILPRLSSRDLDLFVKAYMLVWLVEKNIAPFISQGKRKYSDVLFTQYIPANNIAVESY